MEDSIMGDDNDLADSEEDAETRQTSRPTGRSVEIVLERFERSVLEQYKIIPMAECAC